MLPKVKQSVLFIHIPLVEMMAVWNTGVTRGNKGEDVNCPSSEGNLFEALKKVNVTSVFFGHDHDNDYEGVYQGIRLAYGVKSGYGSYGPPDKHGARVIVLQQDNQQITSSDTWIRYEDGSKYEQELSQKGVGDKQVSCIGPDLMSQIQSHGYPINIILIGCIGFVSIAVCFFVKKRKSSKNKKVQKTTL
eukprot:TRINITY_DN4565_c0_g1_i1.p2 TRINITY_DN4565_c0_g1~~TRINITY_DN4565_c0_g1_i1.p2  ORF type:complete len:211 (-),score=25.84 TRINITY_DN4565_c0_g1_i1:350-919(-)